jgi:hypothetical protein
MAGSVLELRLRLSRTLLGKACLGCLVALRIEDQLLDGEPGAVAPVV